jgi:hypothetical protein
MFLFFSLVISLLIVGSLATTLPDTRPVYEKRSFHSSAIDNLIEKLKPLFNDENLATLFSNTLPNTLDTTVHYVTPNPEGSSTSELDSFVITGDINALWLRDSMNQVLPYVPYVREDKNLQYLFQGLINRHAKSVLIDPFANAFNFNASGDGHQMDIRTPPMKRSVFEGKYEIDSLCAFLKLSYWYWHFMGKEALTQFADDSWLRAVNQALDTIQIMQNDNGQGSNPPYVFERLTTAQLDTLMLSGRGPPAKLTGLSRSLFRPSDDAVSLPYNIPGNAMACVEINHVQLILKSLLENGESSTSVKDTLTKAELIGSKLCDALAKYTSSSATVIPYEVDGYTSSYFMDDANVPSLLSLPVLGYMSPQHTAYQTTRSFVLSAQNPYFFEGSIASGIGGPHVGYNYSWPMALTMRAMTSQDEREIKECLQTLLGTTAGTGLMHESFNVNDPNDYTRDWFAWANGLFGELVLQLISTHPSLVLKDDPLVIAQAQSLVKPSVSLSAINEVLIK